MFRLGPKRTAWGTTALCLLALCASLIVCGQVVSELPLKISGRVVAAGTGTPVPDALVAIETSTTMPLDDPGLNSYVRTDAEGKFTTEARGVVSLRAWKRGYAMRDLLLGKAWRLRWKEVTVELRELSAGKPVEEVTNRYGLEPGEGLVLGTGEVVSAVSPAADLRLVTDSGTAAPLVEALGEGGLLYQPYGGEVDYYNTPEAPASGVL